MKNIKGNCGGRLCVKNIKGELLRKIVCEEYKGKLWRRAVEHVWGGWIRVSNPSNNDILNTMGWTR